MRNPDGNWNGFIVVTSGIIRNQLEPGWKELQYPFTQLPNTEIEIQSLGSLFSPNVESAGSQMGIEVHLLLFNLELLGIS